MGKQNTITTPPSGDKVLSVVENQEPKYVEIDAYFRKVGELKYKMHWFSRRNMCYYIIGAY